MASTPATLPSFIAPMLARSGVPFDSGDRLFEIKWDGIRVLAFVDESGYRLMNRHRVDVTERYPELVFRDRCEPGTILDGEMVVLRNGRADFSLVQARDKTKAPLKIRTLSRSMPATYIAFDLLFQDYRSLLDEPLIARRERLANIIASWSHPQIVCSTGIIGAGRALFAQVCRQNIEGIVAKKLSSKYLPGKRGAAWIKIKPRHP
jgi:bifunctional non-homologous end joining protein LigD